MMRQENLEQLEELLGIEFSDKPLLITAFNHSSFMNESEGLKFDSNERMEFLGDAILSQVITVYLYNKFPEYAEGALTKLRSLLVSKVSLVKIAKNMELGKYLALGKGEILSDGRNNESNLANCLEALIGAIYLDKGLAVAEKFVLSMINKSWDKTIIEQPDINDPKTKLQETLQQIYKKTPIYRVVDHKIDGLIDNFIVDVFLGDLNLGTGRGKSKKLAEQDAASNVLVGKAYEDLQL